MTTILEQNTPVRFKNILSTIAILFFLPFLLYATYQAMSLISRAAGSNASIIVDTKAETGTLNSSILHAFSQGGEEQKNMIEPIVNDVRNLNPKFIRIDHIYDSYSVVSKQGGNLVFDFSRLDNVVNSIIKTGAKPLFSLSYMPPDVSSDGTLISSPKDWNEWAYTVQRTVEHFSGKSEKNLTDVYYEVWNEPDLAQFGSWKTYGQKNYLTLYRYAQIGAERAKNTQPFHLGGPATTGLYKNWIDALIKENLRIDFFSWHTYAEDPEQFSKDATNLVSWLKDYPQLATVPRLITEFGFTGDKDARYGLSYAAAFTAAVYRQLADAPPLYAFSFQLKDGPNEQESKGWGLFTHETQGLKKKPRFFIYSFLDRLNGTRLRVDGEGTWVKALASKNENIYSVALINFDKSGYHSEAVPLTVKSLDPGEYEWSLSYIFSNLNKQKECLTVNTKAESLRIEGTEITKTICLSAQNAALFTLKKK